jgi:hypothetical protein
MTAKIDSSTFQQVKSQFSSWTQICVFRGPALIARHESEARPWLPNGELSHGAACQSIIFRISMSKIPEQANMLFPRLDSRMGGRRSFRV